MSDANVLLEMTIQKAKLIEQMIIQFLGHPPSWNERKAFKVMNRLGESTIYHKGEFVGIVTYLPMNDLAI